MDINAWNQEEYNGSKIVVPESLKRRKKKKAILDMLLTSAYPATVLNTSKNKKQSIIQQLESMENDQNASPVVSGDVTEEVSPQLRPIINHFGQLNQVPRPKTQMESKSNRKGKNRTQMHNKNIAY